MPTVPEKEGYYWAKTGSYQWFNALVAVGGEPPFLTIDWCWDRAGRGQRSLLPNEVKEWGPRVPTPEELGGNEPVVV